MPADPRQLRATITRHLEASAIPATSARVDAWTAEIARAVPTLTVPDLDAALLALRSATPPRPFCADDVIHELRRIAPQQQAQAQPTADDCSRGCRSGALYWCRPQDPATPGGGNIISPCDCPAGEWLRREQPGAFAGCRTPGQLYAAGYHREPEPERLSPPELLDLRARAREIGLVQALAEHRRAGGAP